MKYSYVESPLGDLLVRRDDVGLTALLFDAEADDAGERDDAAFADVRDQLAEYFGGGRRDFALPLHASGTAFQQRVWKTLMEIPYGETASYRDVAEQLGSPDAVRAVGMANSKNPIAIVVPCHRVIGANGSLTGYAGGLENKRWLLSHEAAHSGLFA